MRRCSGSQPCEGDGLVGSNRAVDDEEIGKVEPAEVFGIPTRASRESAAT